jgi:predicted nuclease with TOPRIM domain
MGQGASIQPDNQPPAAEGNAEEAQASIKHLQSIISSHNRLQVTKDELKDRISDLQCQLQEVTCQLQGVGNELEHTRSILSDVQSEKDASNETLEKVKAAFQAELKEKKECIRNLRRLISQREVSVLQTPAFPHDQVKAVIVQVIKCTLIVGILTPTLLVQDSGRSDPASPVAVAIIHHGNGKEHVVDDEDEPLVNKRRKLVAPEDYSGLLVSHTDTQAPLLDCICSTCALWLDDLPLSPSS